MSLVDPEALVLLERIRVASSPGSIVINPAGTRVYVLNAGSSDISVLDGETGQELNRFDVERGARSLAITPAGSTS
ncbi:MAG: YncE family protein [Methyloceanibacter sp.]|uniref:YncE family protein n=1 Tax=Methyloceanibacter sp. TaxID=1965321 RepID=UPI003D9AF9FA